MDLLIEILKSILFGIVEGITEWLPVSSTGHMLLLDQFVKLDVSKDFWDMFLVVIQLGAILAVVILFFSKLNPLSCTKNTAERSNTWKLWAKIIVACIPAAVIGIPLDNWMEDHLGSPFVIAAALIVYGIAFLVIEKRREARAKSLLDQGKNAVVAALAGVEAGLTAPKHMAAPDISTLSVSELADSDAKITDVFEMTWPVALGIGAFQVLSMIPGTSRSGSTIIGGLLLGCSRAVAAEFTFFLAIPVMFGASLLRLVKFFLKGNAFTNHELMILGVGCLVAFVLSLLTVRFLMSFVKRHDFQPFGMYRIVLGLAVVAYFALV
ncbi:undecaprenyl-diphosphate phosphatase [Atopobium fossor]|uniref:undecaprenyl-diphosphate phosphatase n=1 Tax=Atopobium fossor TaxID=39487 RepID=UPI00042399E6|nr:undecaprenyl-diphosphate phosphatase [Atopobium fossor]